MAKNTSKITRIVKSIVTELNRSGISVKYLILYGSYAKGQPRKHSDIDIAVISSDLPKKSIVRRQEILGEAIFCIQEPIEPIGYTFEEYKNCQKGTFLAEIKRTGRIIYANSRV